MLSYRLGTVNDFHWGFLTFFAEEKERKNAFNLSNQAIWNVSKTTGK